MQIVGFNFDKISAEKKKNIEGKLNIKSNINIDEIKKEQIDVFKNQNTLRFIFSFTIDYQPGIANLEFKGNIITICTPQEEKEILKKFKKKLIDDKYRIPLFNIILMRSSVKAIQIEEDLQIPLHIPFPKIGQQQNNANYTG